MENYKYTYQVITIFFMVYFTTALRYAVGTNTLLMIIYLAALWFLMSTYLIIKKDINLISFLYCFCIILGYLFHKFNGVQDTHISEVVIRIIPVMVIIHYNKTRRFWDNRVIKYFAIVFFFLECFLGIYEKITMTHLINYNTESQAMNSLMDDSVSFRSFSLLGHPLENANFVSIFMGFILCSNRIRLVWKLILLGLGIGALWSFNSRAAILVWMVIFLYRVFFYKFSVKWFVLGFFLILILQEYMSYLQFFYKSELLGRLNFDLSDNSTLTRLLAVEIFSSHSWSLNEIIFGGTILYQPVLDKTLSDVPIENGVLLDLGYWGFILGPVKILGEIFITYLALLRFNIKDRLIIMMSLWAVAFMNNNSFYTFLLPFYMCALLSFGIPPKSDMSSKKRLGNYNY